MMRNKKSAVKVVFAVFAGVGLGLSALADGVNVDSLLHESALWLDAAELSSFQRNALGGVTTWVNRSAAGRVRYGDARAYYVNPSVKSRAHDLGNPHTLHGTVELVHGAPAYQMGDSCSHVDLCYRTVTGIRTVFLVGDFKVDGSMTPLLGDANRCDFHRGAGGEFAYSGERRDEMRVWCNSATRAAKPTADKPIPGKMNFVVLESAVEAQSDQLSRDRDDQNRNGGRALHEVIVFTRTLTDAERKAVYDYLYAKWHDGGWDKGQWNAYEAAASGKPVDFASEIRNGRTEVFRQAPFEWHVTPRHDYSKTFVTKLFMAQAEFEPELMGKYKLRDNGKVTTYLTCEQALEVIKGMDAITLGMPKIVYLVGWQYNGHDSKYPAFFEGNPAVKRACDRDALESIRWLMREARKYHTAVSLHVNMFDAYVDSPLYEEYRKADVFAKDKDGKIIESEWGYKVSYAAEWNKGLAQKRLDRLLEVLPVAEAGTLHIDAFHSSVPRPYRRGNGFEIRFDTPISPGHGYSEADEVAAQLNIIKYLDSKGVDVTIEGAGEFSAAQAFIGYIPQYYHFGAAHGHHLKFLPTQSTGVNIYGAKRCLGTHLNGEQVFYRRKGDLPGAFEQFKDEFCYKTLVIDYLNRFGRVSVTSNGGDASAVLSDGVRTLWKGGRMYVERNGRRLVDDSIVCLPATWRGARSLAVYSRAGFPKRSCPIPEGVTLSAGARGWTVSATGLEPFRGFEVKGDRVVLALAPKQMVLIEEDGVAGIARAATKTADQIHMRDPFVVTDPDAKSYCLVSSYFAPPGQKGNDGFTFLGKGVQIYESKDLVNWSAPQQVLEIPDWVDCKALWAPEIHRYKDKWYILGTVNSGKGDRGTWTFVSDSLRGPYRPTGRRSVTPPEWKALDGTLWVEDDRPYMVFCHEWVQIQNGEMCYVQMTEDLSAPVGKPTTLFKATDYTENPKGEGCRDHITDGPFLYRSPKSGKLFMTWSNVDAAGRYLVIVTESASGRLAGPWGNHRVIFEKDGGHGMIFRKFDGSLMFALHRPNSVRNERPRFFEMTDDGKTLTIRRDAAK